MERSKEIQNIVKEATSEHDAKEDTAITMLRKRCKNISEHGICLNVGSWRIRMFGVSNKNGWDFYLINALLCIEYIALWFGSLFPENTSSYLYYLIVSISILGTLLPVFFIFYGGRQVTNIESFIEELFEGVADAKGYALSISQLRDKINGI